MKTVVLNIIGFLVGVILLCCLFPLAMHLISFIISIPILGDILRFGTEHAYIVFPYAVFIASGISGWVTYIICPANKSGFKIGVISFGIIMLLFYASFVIFLFKYNGYDFVFLVTAFCSLIVSAVTIAAGNTKFSQ